MRLDNRAAIIADRIHGNDVSAPCTVEMFAEPFVGLLGLLVAVGPDEAIEDLPQGERQVVGIFNEDAADQFEQRESVRARRPRCKTADPRSPTLCATEQLDCG